MQPLLKHRKQVCSLFSYNIRKVLVWQVCSEAGSSLSQDAFLCVWLEPSFQYDSYLYYNSVKTRRTSEFLKLLAFAFRKAPSLSSTIWSKSLPTHTSSLFLQLNIKNPYIQLHFIRFQNFSKFFFFNNFSNILHLILLNSTINLNVYLSNRF